MKELTLVRDSRSLPLERRTQLGVGDFLIQLSLMDTWRGKLT